MSTDVMRSASASSLPPQGPAGEATGASPKSVYELWRELDFEAVMTSNQEVYEKVINNMTLAAEEKTALLSFVKQFTSKVRGKQTCDKSEIEELLGYFKKAISGMMERCLYGEKAFSSLYRRLGGLPDPTSHLLKLSMAQATVAKLEAELAAKEGAEAELRGLSETGRRGAQEIAALREELAAAAAQAKDRALSADALRAKIRAQADQITAGEDRYRQLEDRCLAVSDSLAKLQARKDDDADGLAEETALLHQQLIDKDAMIADLRLRVDAADAAGRRDLEVRLLEFHERHELEKEKTAAAEAQVAKLQEQVDTLTQERARSKEPTEFPKLDDAEMRKARYEKMVVDLGLAGDAGDAADEVELLMVMKQKNKTLRTTVGKLEKDAVHTQHMMRLLEREKEDMERERVNRDGVIAKLKERLDLLVDTTTAVGSIGAGGAHMHAPQEDAAMDEVFDLAGLIEARPSPDAAPGAKPTEVAIDIGDSAGASQTHTVRLLTTQRQVLKDKVAELERSNADLQQRLNDAARRAYMTPHHSPTPPPLGAPERPDRDRSGRSSDNTPDRIAYHVLRIANSNPITRMTIVVYFVFLHLLVSFVLYYMSMGNTSMARYGKKDTF